VYIFGLDGDPKGPCLDGAAFLQCCEMRSRPAHILKNYNIIWEIVSISTPPSFNYPTTRITLIE